MLQNFFSIMALKIKFGLICKRKESPSNDMCIYSSNTSSMPGITYTPRDVHDLDDQPYYVKVCHQEPKQECNIGERMSIVGEVARMSREERLWLSPNPIPEIPLQALTNFGVSQSVVKQLPQIALSLLGVQVKISTNQVTPIKVAVPITTLIPKSKSHETK